ncbi:MAG: FeoA domain-containing protein [Gammaproteobacteria bacterium]|nr:FeoA domain-containing protein [Gammaproteobacteria bacterium]
MPNDFLPSMRTLNDLRPRRRARIRRHHAAGSVRQRLLALGLTPGAEVLMVRSAPLDDPIELRLEATSITLRRREAGTVEIEDDE